VLPGFDFHLPDSVFERLNGPGLSPLGSQDHPQFRFAKFLDMLELEKNEVGRWTASDPQEERNALISLSLRPAPVTDRWLAEGPALGDLRARTKNLALLEAPQPRDEALAIAVALRQAVERGKTAALITPDRTLGRRVAAALQQWNIVPDDSAGRPLSLTAPGRFLRQVAGMIGCPPDPVDLLALLKHPIAMSADADRGPHLRCARELELYLRRESIVVVSRSVIEAFRDKRPAKEHAWCNWLADWLDGLGQSPAPDLDSCLTRHIDVSEALASGEHGGSGQLWEQTAGRDALGLIAKFRAESSHPGHLPFFEYRRLLDRMLAAASTRNYDTARPDVMIWGTLEARVQGADLVVLGGLNEGIWPEHPSPDPWLNRTLRRRAGLLLPERQVGLSAHDFQQAIAAKEVILARARRDAESETVPSRWLTRLTNLLEGLKDQNGPEALKAMRDAGQNYVDLAGLLGRPDRKVPAEPRPAPSPPRDVRPRDLTVTEIQKLIRDPYSIYARYVLKLHRLNPLRGIADARIRGEVFHDIVEEAFSMDADFSDPAASAQRLRDIGRKHLAKLPWPGVAAHWYGHLGSIADQLVLDEQNRRAVGKPVALERKGRFDVPGTMFAIRGKADRIDRLDDGSLVIYDYKTGRPPTAEELRYFDRQLPIEAVMAELGGFDDIPAETVSHVTHIGLGRTPKLQETPLTAEGDLDLRTITIQGELAHLLSSFDSDTKGYPSRRAMEKVRYDGDYDHLARFGEWDETTPVTTIGLS
jgi:double-strand break repair protein AddB